MYPDFSNQLEKQIGWNNQEVEKSGIKLQYLTGEWKLGLGWIIGNFKKRRVWEIGILTVDPK